MKLVKFSGNSFIGLIDKVVCKKSKFRFEHVNESLFRGSDAAANIILLKKKGVKIILNLKTLSKGEIAELTKEAQKYGIEYVNIPLNYFNPKNSIKPILEVLNKASKENPLFIHCTFGQDRTGFVVALGRILKENLPIKDAMGDMHKNGFHILFYNMERYLKKFDKARLSNSM